MSRYFYNATGTYEPTESFEEAKRTADERGSEVLQHDRRTGGVWTVYVAPVQSNSGEQKP